MKRVFLCFVVLALLLSGCSLVEPKLQGTQIMLSDNGITVDGAQITNDSTQAVYAAKDIVFYLAGQDFTYGEGTEEDAHTQSEADAHTVVHITKPGRYVLSGELSLGQIAVDLGEDAETDPEAVVTLVLNDVDITCQVAPAVIFYNVYECCSSDEESATKDVDTAKAGANVVIADGTENNISGAYVAKIYRSYELSEDGKEVVSSKKLHKYDGAFYSQKTMNIGGEKKGTGILNINAENEGLDSELHLTINGGVINIMSGNDGINTNEDNVSVTTINGGTLNVLCNGSTGEGDGIDSNGWLVINGGTVVAQACAFSGDAGIDSDKGIHINGGTVMAGGHMLDRIEDGGQTYAVFTMGQSNKTGVISMKNADGDTLVTQSVINDYSTLVISSPHMIPGDYTLWVGEEQLKGTAAQGGMGGFGGGHGGNRPTPPEGFEGERPAMPEGELPEGERPEPPAGERPSMPEGQTPPSKPGNGNQPIGQGESSDVFTIREGANYFQIA